MKTSTRYAAEVRERAVRLVREQVGEYASQWAAICSIAGKIGCTAETLMPSGCAAPRSTGTAASCDDGRARAPKGPRPKALECENRELR